jgi:RNA polymerase sigma factor (sigma-70 family)
LITDQASDAVLLECFARGRDEAAFLALVQRHGPRVLKTCRKVLACEHDVEDVFQTTFLILANKAGLITWDESIGPWLQDVARRLALHARAGTVRRRTRERPLAMMAGADGGGHSELREEDLHSRTDANGEIERRELSRVLDEALRQLPEKYRAPVVLWSLEGKTNDEAARELGWPAGSMSRRLERARCLLRYRLAQTGLIVLALACGAFLITRRSHDLAFERSGATLRHSTAATIRPMAHAEIDADGILRRLVRGGEDLPGREQIEALARNSVRAAERMPEPDALENRTTWRLQIEGMGEAAAGLGRAVLVGDRVAMLGTARQLDAACMHCHEAFRPGFSDSGPRSLPWIE